MNELKKEDLKVGILVYFDMYGTTLARPLVVEKIARKWITLKSPQSLPHITSRKFEYLDNVQAFQEQGSHRTTDFYKSEKDYNDEIQRCKAWHNLISNIGYKRLSRDLSIEEIEEITKKVGLELVSKKVEDSQS